jgi:hypothetical protein
MGHPARFALRIRASGSEWWFVVFLPVNQG